MDQQHMLRNASQIFANEILRMKILDDKSWKSKNKTSLKNLYVYDNIPTRVFDGSFKSSTFIYADMFHY